ncbi:MAG TPA: VCBS repeat-containing protein, partial [Gaiellales bacterium]|nr:VCBS repeat-containing protein [Gaiellales bacterium]
MRRATVLVACAATALGFGIVATGAGSPASFAGSRDYPAGHTPLSLVAADVNGDGKQDFVTADYYANRVSVLRGNGDGTFRPPVEYSTGRHPYMVVARDLDGDGKPEIVAANDDSNTISVLANRGDGTFRPPV